MTEDTTAKVALLHELFVGARQHLMERLPETSVHICDENDNDVRARQLTEPEQKMYNALKGLGQI